MFASTHFIQILDRMVMKKVLVNLFFVLFVVLGIWAMSQGSITEKASESIRDIVLKYGLVYILVFLSTILPAGFLIALAVRSLKQNGLRCRRTVWFSLLATFVWFSPSIVTLAFAVRNDAHWSVSLLFGGILFIGVGTFVKKLPRDVLISWKQYFHGLQIRLLLALVGLFVRVEFLKFGDEVSTELIASFRGRHVNWVPSVDGPPRELDRYDVQMSTSHVAVFSPLLGKRWLVGYGRLLFGCDQLVDMYQHVLVSSVNVTQSVEVSRLVIVKSFLGLPVQGTWLSGILQLMIYRRFFQICEEKGVSEWWAILGPKLHQRLLKFGFPFERVNDLQGEDSAGMYYVVRMYVDQARQEVMRANPLLYRWFTSIEKIPVEPVVLGGDEIIPRAVAKFSS